MPTCSISYMKFLFVFVQLGAAAVVCKKAKKHFANCAELTAVLFTTLKENLRVCSSAEAWIVLNLFLNFEQK